MTLPFNGSAFSRFGNSRILIRLLAAGVATVFAGVSMAAEVTVTLSNLAQTYNGSPKTVTVTTNPVGQACTVTYAVSPNPPTTTPPINAGSYAVVVTVDAPNTGPGATGTLIISQATQTITFATLSAKAYGNAPFNLTATSSSGLPVSYMSSNTGVAQISGSTVTIIGVGSTNITASQSGNLNYFPATSVIRSLAINKGNQTITMGAVPAKTYGDAPFTVTASADSGLPITKWESSDPTVATIHSTSGEVTIVGAGQTSILAILTSSTNYNAAWIAKPLNVARSAAALPSGTQTVTYNASAQGLNASALPSGQASEISYRDTTVPEATATPVVVFQNSPDTLDLGYTGTGLGATGLWGMAKYTSLAGTARKLHSCDVTLAAWARYDTTSPNGFKLWADLNPTLVVLPPAPPALSVPGNSGGWYHPVTLEFYDYIDASAGGGTESYRLLTSQTVQAFIPWRPEKKADGTPYTLNSTAFRVLFSFPDGVILPPDVWVAVSFNTNLYGTSPIGAPGPYDALNIAKPLTQVALVGSTLLSTSTLVYDDWRWQSASGAAGPMLRLYAVPTNTSLAAPVNAGSYQVKTKTAAFGTDGTSTSTLAINKAPLAINLTNLTQVRDGNPKPVTVSSTTPAGIATGVTYAGSPTAPSALGSYPVTAISANPNYEGQTNATLRIGDNYASWQSATFATSGLPPAQTTDIADADGDGLSNFLEYASNSNPLLGNQPSPTGLAEAGGTVAFTYRKYLHALDLNYSIQGSTQLAGPLSWAPVTPLSEATLSDDGATRVIQATVEKPANQPSWFLRLKVTP